MRFQRIIHFDSPKSSKKLKVKRFKIGYKIAWAYTNHPEWFADHPKIKIRRLED